MCTLQKLIDWIKYCFNQSAKNKKRKTKQTRNYNKQDDLRIIDVVNDNVPSNHMGTSNRLTHLNTQENLAEHT